MCPLPRGSIAVLFASTFWCFPHTTVALQSPGDNVAVSGGAARGADGRPHSEQPRDILICNAYVHEVPVSIVRASATRQNLTGSDPLLFKECRDYKTSFAVGDFLEFKVGRLNIGIFSVDQLPSHGKLLLIPTRKSSDTLEAKFATHAFAELDTPQVVLMDTYQGHERLGKVAIAHKDARDREEELHMDSALALHPGSYTLSLYDKDSRRVDVLDFQPAARTQNVVLRVGGDLDVGGTASVPQGLLVFPSPRRGSRASAAPVWSAFAAALGFERGTE